MLICVEEDPGNKKKCISNAEYDITERKKLLTGTGGAVRNKQHVPRPAPPISCNVRIFIKFFLKRNKEL